MENHLRPVALIVCLLAVLVISWATFANARIQSQNPPKIEAEQGQAAPSQEEAARPELHRAAQSDDLEILRSRLRQGGNPDERDKAMRTPLMDAVKADRVE